MTLVALEKMEYVNTTKLHSLEHSLDYILFLVRGSNPGGSEIFRIAPERPCGLHSPPYNGVPDLFPVGKAPGAWL